MKNFGLFFLPVLIAGGLLAFCSACGESDATPPVTKIGLLTFINATEDEFFEKNDSAKSAARGDNPNTKTEPVSKPYEYKTRQALYFDSLDSMLLALKSDRINYATVLKTTALFAQKQMPGLGFLELNDRDAISMAVLRTRDPLVQKLNDAILAIKERGELDQLVKTYISDVIQSGKLPQAVPLPTDGSTKLKVAVSGDLPPLDYADADGKPAGFNLAFLAALAKEADLLLEVVPVTAGSRAAALKSGAADIIFWMRSDVDPNGNPIPGLDVPEDVLVTLPYFIDNIVLLRKKYPGVE